MAHSLDVTRLEEVFDALENNTNKLSAKQIEIVESLRGYFDRRGMLTEAQLELLEDIYLKV